ncbi:carbon-nitrogen hydrolase family protein [Catenovulum sp. SM1970]|uniref:carbon-nitrogen hydrolase family protein n=1 Tax=Marinifaba aquimaris TaxID=2741323 RepID=UPI0015747B72|nr:carbon-nitrogen hydrolase family protein [Marinifaba aquimaris]NTS75878.1 carbon-nitrogen hydrolase family protein [Marinifaba aquimaris]
MPPSLSAVALQMSSVPDVAENMAQVEQLLSQLNPAEHTIVVLPECWAMFGGKDKAQLNIAEPLENGPIQTFLSQQAKQHSIWLVSGTIPILSTEPGKFYACCIVYSPDGKAVCHYNKIHLFDVQVADNTGQYLESATTTAGQHICCFDTPFGKVGVAVCYDLRFPELFRLMQSAGADVICLPSAFTKVTGDAHWQPLLQARAIENQVFVIAANQTGEHANGRQTWGHSMVINSWGEVMCNQEDKVGLCQQQINFTDLQTTREKMPNLAHRQFKVVEQL